MQNKECEKLMFPNFFGQIFLPNIVSLKNNSNKYRKKQVT